VIVGSLTDEQLYTAGVILCEPEQLKIEQYQQDQFDGLTDTIRELQIAAHEADHPWLADSLEAALQIAEDRFLERAQ